MIKHRIGIAKQQAALQRRLDRGRAKAERKQQRHKNCKEYGNTGQHIVVHDIDGSPYCDVCFRWLGRWF
jgi:hypothetical protein